MKNTILFEYVSDLNIQILLDNYDIKQEIISFSYSIIDKYKNLYYTYSVELYDDGVNKNTQMITIDEGILYIIENKILFFCNYYITPELASHVFCLIHNTYYSYSNDEYEEWNDLISSNCTWTISPMVTQKFKKIREYQIAYPLFEGSFCHLISHKNKKILISNEFLFVLSISSPNYKYRKLVTSQENRNQTFIYYGIYDYNQTFYIYYLFHNSISSLQNMTSFMTSWLNKDDKENYNINLIIPIFYPFYSSNFYKITNKICNKYNGIVILSSTLTQSYYWNDNNNYISKDMIMGVSLDTVFYYHNRVKDILYEIANHEHPNKIIDLNVGIGQGGDLIKLESKFKKTPLKTVFGIDPSKKNLIEFQRRLSLFKNASIDYYILEAYGQDDTKITSWIKSKIGDEKVNNISLMLSLSFFWESEQVLDLLIKTMMMNIHHHGTILFFTIDSQNMKNDFDVNQSLHFFDVTYTWKKKTNTHFGNKMLVTIPNTIVGNDQVEFMVYIDDLTEKLQFFGFELKMIEKANKEYILSPIQLAYSQMYSYGYYKGTFDQETFEEQLRYI